MGGKWIVASLLGVGRGRTGLWDFLVSRAVGNSRVSLEESRNQGTQEVIRLLQSSGGTVREGGSEWARRVTVPPQVPPSVRVSIIVLRYPDGLSRAPAQDAARWGAEHE